MLLTSHELQRDLMAKGPDYKIEKLEKGPLQRFKNQNLLLKKFGEVGLQVYKVITGKRTAEELRKDLDMDAERFSEILKYMEDAGMIKLSPAGGVKAEEKAAPEAAPEEAAPEELALEEEKPPEEKLPARKGKKAPFPEEEEAAPPEEAPPEGAPRKKKRAAPEEEIAPEGIAPEFGEEEKPPEEKLPARKGRKAPLPEEEEAPPEEEMAPQEITPEFGGEEAAPKKKKRAPPEEEEAAPEEAPPEEEIAPEGEEVPPEEALPGKRKREEEALAPETEFGAEGAPEKGGEEESPVEKIIRDKYGDIGIRVYTLIDGQKTAEEIMEETGLDEAKLVEILDFLDEQGIIKLEYPKGKPEAPAAAEEAKEMPAEEFAPMIEGEEEVEKAAVKEVSPDLLPARAPVPIVKSVQVRAKTMLRYGDAGDKLLAAVDGKADIIDIALKLNMPLHKVVDMLNFVRDEGGVMLSQVQRADVRRKYGDDGFTVYKKYGKEGLMLYELIGKELTIKDMAERVTKDKAKVVDMFLFIYEVLGIEMPLNKEALVKQLGL